MAQGIQNCAIAKKEGDRIYVLGICPHCGVTTNYAWVGYLREGQTQTASTTCGCCMRSYDIKFIG